MHYISILTFISILCNNLNLQAASEVNQPVEKGADIKQFELKMKKLESGNFLLPRQYFL